MALQIPTVTIDDLSAFHAKHFPHARAPEHFLHGIAGEPTEEYYEEEDDGLGYYPDGRKRTLTDEQIAMFRHSEIHSILRKRRLRRENDEPSEEGEASSPQEGATPTHDSPAPLDAAGDGVQRVPAIGPLDIGRIQTGRVEKPKTQQWATSSARTKARNRKHRSNCRAKRKREEKERSQKAREREAEESDEWDPWHQATGPDAQQAESLELDY